MRILRKMMRRDPKAARDSLYQARLLANKEKDKSRILGYQKNVDIDKLTSIDLSNGDFEEIPDFVFNASNLEHLILDDNQIVVLPKELQDLEKLRSISWDRNHLGKKKVRTRKLKGLEQLSLIGNDLSKVPKLRKLRYIQKLDLKGNEFTSIPIKHLRKLKHLNEVNISSNPLELRKAKYFKLSNIKKLTLSKCDLDSIHPTFYQMSSLEELNMSENKLTHLPDGISNLSNLINLSLYKNELQSLTADMGDLEQLEEIDLYYNQLKIIPGSIGNLQRLRILYLSHNQIYDLTEEVGNLGLLEELYVHHNRLSSLPANISKLDRLRILHFQNNYLLQFPESILDLRNLQDLDISFNDLTVLPAGIEKMGLKNFYFRGLDIDFENQESARQREMVLRMVKRGVNCKPEIWKESE